MADPEIAFAAITSVARVSVGRTDQRMRRLPDDRRRGKKKARVGGPSVVRCVRRGSVSGGLAVDFREVVLGRLGAVGHKLADILSRSLGAGHEQFAAG